MLLGHNIIEMLYINSEVQAVKWASEEEIDFGGGGNYFTN